MNLDDLLDPAPAGGSEPPAPAAPVGGSEPPTPAASDNPEKPWYSALPPELADQASLKVFKDPAALAKGYVDLKKAFGGKQPTPPDALATPEQVTAWRKIVGVPEKPDDYGELRPENVAPEIWGTAPEDEARFREVFHANNIPPTAAKAVTAQFGEYLLEQVSKETERMAQEQAADMAALEKAWGPDTRRRVNQVAAFLQQGGLDIREFGNSKALIGLHQLMTATLGEKRLATGTQGITAGIEDQIADIINPTGTSRLSLAYQGKGGLEAQREAQKTLRDLRATLETQKRKDPEKKGTVI